jgi:hypothetical protein
MGKIGAVVVKEIREALPATLFFLFLFHMLALTRAVSLNDYSFAAVRAVSATVAALIVAKAILVVEALPLSVLHARRRWVAVLSKTLLYGIVVLIFKVVEEAIPLISKHAGLISAMDAMLRDVSWPLFIVSALWVAGGLLLYCVAAEMVAVVGPRAVREIFLGTDSGMPDK